MARARDFASSRFCHLCGRQLIGRYVRYETGLTVCASCERTRPRCARCSVPLSDSAIAATRGSGRGSGGVSLCAECSRTASRCAACAQPLLGVFYTFENPLVGSAGQERKFCARCVQHRPRCDLCSAPVAEGTAAVADGQWRCGVCATDLVLAEDGARIVYRQATAAFARVVGSALHETPRLEVVGRREMGALRRRYAPGRPGAAGGQADGDSHADSHHVLGYFVSSKGAATIYVEQALPRPLLLGTLAHELGHAWQAERAPGLRDLLLSEGFAEWVAHRVLVGAGLQAIAARATRRDDIYGRGLRHFLELERRTGRAGVLAAVQQMR